MSLAWLVSMEERGVLSVRARVGVTGSCTPAVPALLGRSGGEANLPSVRRVSVAPAGGAAMPCADGMHPAGFAIGPGGNVHAGWGSLAARMKARKHTRRPSPRLEGVANSRLCKLTRSSSLTKPPPSAVEAAAAGVEKPPRWVCRRQGASNLQLLQVTDAGIGVPLGWCCPQALRSQPPLPCPLCAQYRSLSSGLSLQCEVHRNSRQDDLTVRALLQSAAGWKQRACVA